MEEIISNHDYISSFNVLFYNSPIGVAIVSKDGEWLKINKRIADMLGYSQDELLSMTFQDVTHPDDLDSDLELYNRVLNNEIVDYSLIKRYIKKNGDELNVMLIVNGVFDDNNNIMYFVSQIVDLQEIISKQKKINSINNDLNSFIKIASHDLREPLRNINISLNNIMNYLVFRNINANSYICEIEQNLKLLDNILDDFSIYASIDIDLKSKYNTIRMAKFFIDEFPTYNIECNSDFCLNIKYNDLYYLFFHLINNSEKFSYRKKNYIKVEYIDSNTHHEILYKDNGIGIPSAFHNKVFLPFFQLEPKKYNGNGIGLAICKKICEKYDGDISILESSSNGTTFKIRLKKNL